MVPPQQARRPSRSPTPSSTKATRLSRACDGCSLRKVKCDQTGPPCRACRSLNIPCTFDRPARRRGPPNRHAEALKSQQRQPSPSGATTVELVESLMCPRQLAQRVIDDYFVYVHPLMPVPHEPWFRSQLRVVPEHPQFVSLIASLLAVAASCQPQRLLLHLQDLKLSQLFGSSEDFVRKCIDTAVQARPRDLLQSGEFSVWDAVTSFLLGYASAAYANKTASEMLMGESLNMLQALGHGQTPTVSTFSWDQDENLIHQQTGRRLYWIIFKAAKSSSSLRGIVDTTNISTSPEDRLTRHPPLPEAVSDEQITAASIDRDTIGPGSIIMTGFNACRRICQANDVLGVLDMLRSVEEQAAAIVESRLLCCALFQIEGAIANLGQEYSLYNDAQSAAFSMALDSASNPASRHVIALTLQRIDVFIAYLSSKSLILERAWMPSQTGERGSPLGHYDPATERLAIGRQLLTILEQTPAVLQVGLGYGLSQRIRQIAPTLMPYVGQQAQTSFDVFQSGMTEHVREEAAYLLRELTSYLTRLATTNVAGGGAQASAGAQQVGQSSSSSLAPPTAVQAQGGDIGELPHGELEWWIGNGFGFGG